ncbi:MAG: hypothetical protein OXE59_01180 [Bacteroidetes bacterium]|nr:hypothetical protein [Bacteroidota bacterium]MCY4232348.1 hypothetical protein [Bacteroidota bacterium]
MGDQIHYRLPNGTICTGPVESPIYELWVKCCVKECPSWIQIPDEAVQAWCWKCRPRNTGNWRDLHIQRLKDTELKRHEHWVKYNCGERAVI